MNQYIQSIKYLLVFPLFLLTGIAIAQTPAGQEELTAEELEIVKKFNAKLGEANKKVTQPSLPEIKENNRGQLQYQIPPKLLSIKYPAPTIKPIAMRKGKLPEVYQLWAKLGYGTPNSPLAEVIYNNAQSEQFDVYARIKHHSANADKLKQNQIFGENEVELKGKYFLDNGLAVGADLGLDLDKVHFYGYNQEDTLFTKEQAAQQFTTIHGGLSVENSTTTVGAFNYGGHLKGYNHSSKRGANEFGIGAGLKFLKWFNDKHFLELKLDESLVKFSHEISSVVFNNNVFSVAPSFTYVGDRFKVKVGAWAGIDTSFAVYPDIEASLFLLDGKASVFAGWNGFIQQNSFRKITDYNPFVQDFFFLFNSRVENRYGGVRGKVNAVSFELKFTQRPVKSMPLYLNNVPLFTGDSMQRPQFFILYDDVNMLNFHATVSTTLIDKLEILLTGDYNVYNTFLEESPWQLPNLEVNVSAKYQLIKGLRLKGELFMAGGANYRNELGEVATQKALLDLSFGGEYQITKNLGVFLDVNNITGSNYQRWNLYPQYGLNFMGGVKLRL